MPAPIIFLYGDDKENIKMVQEISELMQAFVPLASIAATVFVALYVTRKNAVDKELYDERKRVYTGIVSNLTKLFHRPSLVFDKAFIEKLELDIPGITMYSSRDVSSKTLELYEECRHRYSQIEKEEYDRLIREIYDGSHAEGYDYDPERVIEEQLRYLQNLDGEGNPLPYGKWLWFAKQDDITDDLEKQMIEIIERIRKELKIKNLS